MFTNEDAMAKYASTNVFHAALPVRFHEHGQMNKDFAQQLRTRLQLWIEENAPGGTFREWADLLGISSSLLHQFLTDPDKGIAIGSAQKIVAAMSLSLDDITGTKGRIISEDVAPYSPATPRLPVVGRINAGSGAAAIEDARDMLLNDDVWASSPSWRYGSGPVLYLSVDGDSMAPDYAVGSLIAVRRAAPETKSLPNLMPCIFVERSTGKHTFKLYGERHGGRARNLKEIMGIPLNRQHVPLFWKPREVAIWGVVTGKIEVWPGNRHSQP